MTNRNTNQYDLGTGWTANLFQNLVQVPNSPRTFVVPPPSLPPLFISEPPVSPVTTPTQQTPPSPTIPLLPPPSPQPSIAPLLLPITPVVQDADPTLPAPPGSPARRARWRALPPGAHPGPLVTDIFQTILEAGRLAPATPSEGLANEANTEHIDIIWRRFSRAIGSIGENSNAKYKKVLSEEGLAEIDKITFDLEEGDQPETCPILGTTFKKGDILGSLSCGHRFEYEAIMRWLKTESATCPVCRKQLPSVEKKYEPTARQTISRVPRTQRVLIPRHALVALLERESVIQEEREMQQAILASLESLVSRRTAAQDDS